MVGCQSSVALILAEIATPCKFDAWKLHEHFHNILRWNGAFFHKISSNITRKRPRSYCNASIFFVKSFAESAKPQCNRKDKQLFVWFCYFGRDLFNIWSQYLISKSQIIYRELVSNINSWPAHTKLLNCKVWFLQ